MSRIGRKVIPIPSGVAVNVADREVTVKGPKGELRYRLLPGLEIDVADAQLEVKQSSTERDAKAFWGLTRALVANMVVGVSEGYSKGVELHGTGYRAELQGKTLMLHLGYSHPIHYALPDGITATIEGSKIKFDSIDKQLIGQVAAEVRSFRPPEPYNGKGVRYEGEQIKQKAGKSAAAAGS